jgi:hypothetical protein
MSDEDEYEEEEVTEPVHKGFAPPTTDDLEEHNLKGGSAELAYNNHNKKHTVMDDENLGEFFEETPWVPPSLAKAVEFRQHAIFRSGVAPLSTVNLCRAPDLGNGMALYFQFVRSMGVCMFVMMLLSIPTLVFAYFGSRMPQEDRDGMSLYLFTLGNIGYNKNSASYASDSACKSFAAYMNVNETCIHLPMDNEISLSAVGSIISLMELLQIFVFFCTVYHLKRRVDIVGEELSRLITAVTDYSILVKNIPKDTKQKELIEYFSALCPLDRVDWAGRPALAGARPVESVSIDIVIIATIYLFTIYLLDTIVLLMICMVVVILTLSVYLFCY